MSTPLPVEATRKLLPQKLTRFGWILLALGIVLYAAGYAVDVKRGALNNVVGFLFLASLASGALFLVALEYIAGAVWSVPMRRVTEFLAALTPITPLLGLPLLFSLGTVFEWTHPAALVSDEALALKSPYLNVPFFIVRFVGVFAFLSIFYFLLIRNSVKQDSTGDQKLTTSNIRLSAVFMPVFSVLITILAVDWAMSLQPDWYSTIIGVYYFAGTVLAGLAASTYVIVKLHENGYMPGLRKDHFYSLGALLFAFVNFWAYIAFAQFLLIWYANLPEETFWFVMRWRNGWQYVSVLLIIFQFAVPYFALLTQDSKMDLKRLKFMSIWLLFAHLLDMYWLVMPSYGSTVPLGWMEFGFPVLLVGLVLVVLSYKMKSTNIVPIRDPKLQRAMEFRLWL